MAPPEDETAPEPDNLNKRVVTIQYADDVETGHRGRTQRRDSNDDGMSIRSISRRYIVDPGTVLPAQYRTL